VRDTFGLLAATFAGIVAALGAVVPLARGDAKPATISVAEIKPGMKGYGLTVFRGTQPERFDVEVIGILQGFHPGQPLIVIKTPNPRLDVAKTVKGMSGSPIFFDGRLAGAYSYSLSQFELEPVAGVTPIERMLTELHRPIPPGFWPLEGGPPLPRTRAQVGPGRTDFPGSRGGVGNDFAETARQLAESPIRAPLEGGFVPASTPVMISGFGDRTAKELRSLLEPFGLEALQAGGGGGPSDPDAPTHFVNGGSLGVQLARGDISATGLGTATYVDGEGRIAGFGHPMLGGGDEAIPACIGRILWIEASAESSYKIGECARWLGTLVQDRPSGIVVDERVAAPVIPIDVDLSGVIGGPRNHWHAEVTADRFLGPGFTGGAIGSLIEETTSERRDLTWKLTSDVSVEGHGTVRLEDFGVSGIGASADSPDWGHTRVVNTVFDVMNNPWQHVRISSIRAHFDVKYAKDLWRLRGADLVAPIVDAGDKAQVRLHFEREDGPEVVRIAEVALPEELAGKDVELEIVPGYEVVPDLAPPDNLDELLANEPRQSLEGKTIVIQFRLPSQGLADRGHVTPRLPSFTLDALRPQSSDSGPELFPSWSRTVVPLDFYVEGRDKLKVKVRSVLW
jgi:hypothetical protein